MYLNYIYYLVGLITDKFSAIEGLFKGYDIMLLRFSE